jgi:AcrR family transcriptional regulator
MPPYRHYPNHEALLVELAIEGFEELRAEIAAAASGPGPEDERISDIGAAYMRFVARRPALARLMFGPQLPNRDSFPDLGAAADSIGSEIGSGPQRHRSRACRLGRGARPRDADSRERHRSRAAPLRTRCPAVARRDLLRSLFTASQRHDV